MKQGFKFRYKELGVKLIFGFFFHIKNSLFRISNLNHSLSRLGFSNIFYFDDFNLTRYDILD